MIYSEKKLLKKCLYFKSYEFFKLHDIFWFFIIFQDYLRPKIGKNGGPTTAAADVAHDAMW